MNNYNPFSLSGKTILVTGASSGIGKATAIECSRMGAKVIITARNEERLKETLSEMDGDGHSYFIADLTVDEQMDALVNSLPALDGFVCNAGVGLTKPLTFYKRETIAKVFEPNLIAPMLLVKALVKKKKLVKGASIVFTSSVASRCNTIGNGIYAAGKAALSSFMRTCAVELAPKEIRVNSILPGMVETSLTAPGTIDAADMEKDKEHYFMHRYGKPEEIAYAMVYLLSDAAAWITGSELKVDGGLTRKYAI